MGFYPLFLGVDIGTTNVRSLIFDTEGKVLGEAFRRMRIYSPRPGWAEEEPEEIWQATLETMRDALRASKVSADDVAMISFSSQMHGMTLIDKEGKPITRLLTWADLRAAPQVEELSGVLDSYELYSRTGCPLLFIYPLVKVLWAKDNVPEKLERCFKILSAKDYVMYRMFGEPYLDRSVASGSQFLNVHDLRWDERVLEAANIDEDKLPTLRDGTEVVGELPKGVADHIGLEKGTPVILGASDAALSNVGLGSVERGVGAINTGSSGAIRVMSDKPFIDKDESARFFCYYAGLRRWIPGGAVNNAGIILRWFRNVFGQLEIAEAEKMGVDPYEVITDKAAEVRPGAEGLIIVPFFSGERFPVRDSKARGVIFGLTLTHSRAHIIRAIMEGVVYTLRWIMEAMEEQGIKIDEVRSGGGGARSPVWRQIQADVLGKSVIHTKVEEASALGAGMLAAISLGIYKDSIDASRGMVKVEERHEPNLKFHRRYLEIFKLYRELYGTSKRFYGDLKKIQEV